MANEEEQGREQPESAIDRINDARRQAQRIKNDAQNIKKGVQVAQKGVQAVRTGAQAAQAAIAAVQEAIAAAQAAAAAAGTSEFWGPVVAIIAAIVLLLVLFIAIIIIISGGSGQKSDCELAGGKCQLGVCGTGFGQTSDACPSAPPANTPQTCCMPQQPCGSMGGTCEKGPNCAGTSIGSGDCEANGGKCQLEKCGGGFGQTSNHCQPALPANTPQTCCMPQQQCGSLGGKCEKGPTNCSLPTETASQVGTCTGATDPGPLCCLPPATETPSQVGTCTEATDPGPLCCIPISLASGSDIVSWAQIIANNLKNVGWGFCAQPNTSICNATGYCAMHRSGLCQHQAESQTYYCTDLVIDAYNLAGVKNNFSDYVPYMISNWRSKGWTVLTQNNSASISQLKPGDVIFFMSNPNDQASGDHVAIISSVNVTCTTSSGCSGTISILQANSNTTAWTFSVINGKFISTAHNVAGQLMQPWFGLAGR